MTMTVPTLIAAAQELAIFIAQAAVALFFAIFALTPLIVAGYRALIFWICFASGAMAKAVVNTTVATKDNGPLPMAFLIVPLVSAIFVDIANAGAIQFVVNF